MGFAGRRMRHGADMTDLRVSTRLALLAVVVAAVAGGAAWLAVGLSYRDGYRAISEARFTFIVSEIASDLETALGFGFELDDLGGNRALADLAPLRSPGVDAITVFDAEGRVLFGTDPSDVGVRIPHAWLEQTASGDRSWRSVASPAAVGTLLENGFGQIVGGVALSHDHALIERQTTDAWTVLGLMALAVAAAVAAAGIPVAVALSRRARRVLAALAGGLTMLAGAGAARDPAEEPTDDSDGRAEWPVQTAFARYRQRVSAAYERLNGADAEIAHLDESA